MTLREFIEHASLGLDAVFEMQGHLRPMWHYVDRYGHGHVMPAPPLDKDTAAQLMRALFDLMGVTRYIFIDEAWVAEIRDAEEAAKAMEWRKAGGKIKDYPGRVECVILSGEDEGEGFLMARRTIDRSGPKLGPLEVYEADGFEGRMVGMLPRKGGLQ